MFWPISTGRRMRRWRPLRGDQLKKLRLAVGASVEDTSRALRRTPEELREIERDNLPVSLLVEARLRGFLKRQTVRAARTEGGS